jgi:hypothetical protein
MKLNGASIISVLTHPIWLPLVVASILWHYYPGLYPGVAHKDAVLWLIQIGVNTILFPLLVTVLIYKLGFAKNILLNTTQERLGPLMATTLFYFWNFYVFHKLHDAPMLLKGFLLGTFFTVSALFCLSIFVKVSMHMAAWAGVTTLALLAALSTSLPIHSFWAIGAAGISLMVAWARLAGKHHTTAELVLGTIVGGLAQGLVWVWYT